MTEPIITIKQGQIKGTEDTDLFGGRFYKFMVIPFAKPPVGQLRFKAPLPAEPWDDVRDCTKDEVNAGCLCYEAVSKTFMGSEDCLYISVYTRQLPSPESKPKPVMVCIHGGGFTVGSGAMGGPKYLLTEDVVYVTFNYRTGIFGFLSSDDLSLDTPGNAGLKDQVLALKWVQENISYFNGDKNNVTIFGLSAGGSSVSLQVASPASKGLFHKAIVQSGTALSPWAWGQKNIIQVAEKVTGNVFTEKEALEVLLETPANTLIKVAFVEFPDVLTDFHQRRPFCPVIEKPNATAFLTESPLDLFASGRYNQVPLIQGITSNEGMIFEMSNARTPVSIKPESGAIWYLGLENDKEKSTEIAKAVESFYFNNGMTKDAIYKFVGDVMFMYDVVISTKLISKTSACPVYMYVYSRECPLSLIQKKLFNIDDNIKGISHGGDQGLLLDSPFFLKNYGMEMDDENVDAVKQYVKMWTDFARTGKPHPDWEPVTNEKNLKYFDIDRDATLKENPFRERFAFWEKVFKDAPSINLRLSEIPKL